MPFLSLPKDPSALRFNDGEVVIHYLLSTPSCRTFVHARHNAASFESAATPSLVSRHRKRLSSGSPESRSRSRASSLVQSGTEAKELELDPNYPVLFFLPSESFSCAHLFAEQLADEELAARFNLVAADPRGHGLTKEVQIPKEVGRHYDLDAKAADVAAFILRICNRATGTPVSADAAPHWSKGIHLLACSMSGLVAARIASLWPEAITSVMVTSPILELESEFMIESFQGIQELIEETWHEVHHGSIRGRQVKMPGEVVQGCTYRWAGEESIPRHIGSYLNKTWLDRLILHEDGIHAARDWWFDLYWLRQPMPAESRNAIRCEMLVVEGSESLPYERTVGGDYKQLFPNCKTFEHQVVDVAPFLLSVTRPDALRTSMLRFLSRFSDGVAVDAGTAADLAGTADAEAAVAPVYEAVERMTPDERFELIKVYAPTCVPTSDDENEDAYESVSDEEAVYQQVAYKSPIVSDKLGDNEDRSTAEAGPGFSGITAVTTVETFLTSEEVDYLKHEHEQQHQQQQQLNRVSELLQNLEVRF